LLIFLTIIQSSNFFLDGVTFVVFVVGFVGVDAFNESFSLGLLPFLSFLFMSSVLVCVAVVVYHFVAFVVVVDWHEQESGFHHKSPIVSSVG
jgi:hypothetical protein